MLHFRKQHQPGGVVPQGVVIRLVAFGRPQLHFQLAAKLAPTLEAQSMAPAATRQQPQSQTLKSSGRLPVIR